MFLRPNTRVLLIPLVAFLVGCGDVPITNIPPQNERICCFGDSLVAGVGARSEAENYPAFLAAKSGRAVVNWGTPGDTTADGLEKTDQFIDEKFGIVIVTLGGNDILRRLPWPETKANLHRIFQSIQRSGAVVVFTGVTGPLNPSRNRLYRNICAEEGVLFVPEILDGILQDSALRADSVHPNSAGYKMVADRVHDALSDAGLLRGSTD